MGTDSPNPNAVLELVAKDKNQGLLIPRLSDGNLASLADQLTPQDQGLLIFAEELGAFCYWWNNEWNILSINPAEGNTSSPSGSGNLSYVPGRGIRIEGQTINNIGDLDSTNELQSLAAVLERGSDADQQRITNVANPVDSQDVATKAFVTQQVQALPPPTLQYDNSTQTLNLSGGDAVDLSKINTDDQDLTLNGNVLSLTNDGSPVGLSATNPTNGQVLSWNAGGNQWESRTLVGATPYTAGSGISINGSNQVINTAPDQTVNLVGSGPVTVSGTYPNFTIGSADLVNDADSDPANEIQDLSLSGNNLRITNNSLATTLDLSPYLDDTDQQTLSLAGNTLAISNGNDVDLSGVGSTNTDNQTLSSNKVANNVTINIAGGNNTSFSVADNDNNATNETITSANLITGDVLRIQEAGANYDVNFSGFQKKVLPDSHILVGNSSGVATPVELSGDITLNADGTMTINVDAITTAKILNQAVTTNKLADNAVTPAKLANDAVTRTKINSNVAGDGLSQAANGSLQTANTAGGEILIGQGTQATAQTVSGDVTLAANGSTTVEGLQGRPVSTTAPLNNQVLTWDGSSWIPNDALGEGEQWYSGNGAPTALSPVTAVNGDFYYDTANDIVYFKQGGSWAAQGGFGAIPNAPVNMGGDADSYRTPLLYIGDDEPEEGDDIGAIGDFYYSREEEKLYYRLLDLSNGKIKWKSL